MHPNILEFLRKNPFPCMCYLALEDGNLHFFILETKEGLDPLPQMQRVPMAVSYYSEGRTIVFQVTFVLGDDDHFIVETEFPWDEAGSLFEMLKDQDILSFHLIDESYRFLTTKQVYLDKKSYLHFLASFKEHILGE